MNSNAQPVREWPLLLVLSGAQFSHILDFVIMMPLGPQFMRTLAITPQQFGFLVSIYTFSAALCGFMGAFWIDRFDRKSALLTLYAGFSLGTLLCAVAPNYETLLVGRAVAGAFGGVMGAVVFAIVGDSFSEGRRGTAMGTVMSAFSLASVIGVPAGLWLSKVNWSVPFYAISILSLVMMGLAAVILKPMRGHLLGSRKLDFDAELKFLIFTREHWPAFGMIVMLMFGAFSVIPFLATYLVTNVGLTEQDLPYVYLVGGFFTLMTSRLIGRLADRHGKKKVFRITALISIIPLLLITNMPHVSVGTAIFVTTLFTVIISGRAVPALSMITSTVTSRHRGSFMSLTSAIQQMASGLATLLGGAILIRSQSGELIHYDWVGFLAVGATIVSIYLANRLKFAAS